MTITGQIADAADVPVIALAAAAALAPQALKPPGLPVPDDRTAVTMFTAHRVDEMQHQLTRATERMQAARAASGELRAYHSAHVRHHLANALEAAHGLTANIREHYPGEAAELEEVKQHVGLAKSLTPAVKAATTAHLLETTLHECTHGVRHAEAMLHTDPGDVWEFNTDHAQKHLHGALEHASKLARHFRDNYPDVAGWLAGLGEITAGAEDGDGKQHAGYRKTGLATISAQALEMASTISAQVDLAEVNVRPFQRVVQTKLGPREELVRGHAEDRDWIPEPKWQAGQKEWEAEGEAAWKASRARSPLPWTDDGGDVMRYNASLGVDRADMPQISGILADGRYAPSSEMMPKFLDHLRSRGIGVTRERVPARSLRPTQATGDMRAVRGLADSLASGQLEDTKPVLVSSDNRVIDGHHQWAAHVLGESEGKRTGSAPGEPVIRADLPAGQLLEEARQFAKEQGIASRKTGVVANPLYARPEAPGRFAAPATISGQVARGGDREGIRALPTDAQNFVAAMNMDRLPEREKRPTDTYNMYMRADGTWKPGRAALHQQIVDDILAGHKPQEHPVATFFGGGPASGKSTALKPSQEDSALIDSDAIKARLPEYQQMLDAKDPRAAAFVHEESSHIARQAVRQAQKQHLNYVLDGTGDSHIDKLAGKVSDARKHGYLTEGKYVTVGTDEAVRRARARAEKTGRHVPETTVREIHAAVSDTYAKAVKMGLFDRSELWDTTGAEPALVAAKEPGGKFEVKDPQAWQRFQAKANERVSQGRLAEARESAHSAAAAERAADQALSGGRR